MSIEIREITVLDNKAVADIHARELKDSFLGQIGYGFLKKLYRHMFEEPSFKCFVAEFDGTVCGYIAITLDNGSFYKSLYKKHFFAFASAILLKGIRRPKILFRALQIFLAKAPDENTLNDKVELLSIAVLEEQKYKGVGKKLIGEASLFLKKINKKSIFVIVNTKNAAANKFYQALGFIIKGQHRLHGDLMNLYVLRTNKSNHQRPAV